MNLRYLKKKVDCQWSQQRTATSNTRQSLTHTLLANHGTLECYPGTFDRSIFSAVALPIGSPQTPLDFSQDLSLSGWQPNPGSTSAINCHFLFVIVIFLDLFSFCAGGSPWRPAALLRAYA